VCLKERIILWLSIFHMISFVIRCLLFERHSLGIDIEDLVVSHFLTMYVPLWLNSILLAFFILLNSFFKDGVKIGK
jgi:hypothetical protein